MKFVTLALFLFFCVQSAHTSEKVIIKASILKGDYLATASTNPKAIEDIFKTALSEKDFQIIDEINSDDEILFVDIFVYQFAGEFPTVTVTIRTLNGIHFIDTERTTMFLDRNAANIKLAKKLAERLPAKIDKNALFKLTTNDLLASNSISFKSNTASENEVPNYSSMINWSDNKAPSFIIPNEIHYYVAYISNNYAIRNKLKNNSIKLALKINNEARFEIIDIESKMSLTEKEKSKLKEFIDSFPLWAVTSPMEKIEMKIGVE